MYYYLLLNKLYLLKCNLIEAKFDKFARIWMQHPMWFRVIISGIVFIIIIIIINEHFNVHTVNLINVMLNYTYK